MRKFFCAAALTALFPLGCSANEASTGAASDQAITSASVGHLLGVAIDPTVTINISGVDTTLTTVGAGIRSKQPVPGYVDANDPLSDLGADGMIPYFVSEIFVPDVSAVVRTPAPNYNTPAAFNNPFLDSIAAQSPVVMRFVTVRNVDSDLFTVAMEKKFIGNQLTDEPGLPSIHPEDTQQRADFLMAYRKIGWYNKGDFVDFIVERDTDGGAKVTQILHTMVNGVMSTRTLYPTEGLEGPRLPYVKGGPSFGKQIVAIMTGFNNDAADPGMAACRQGMLSGNMGN